MSQIRFTLRDLIRMMWENIIHAATVNVHVFSKMFDTDTGTLDMPAWISDTPWAFPFQFLIVKF